jgi:hypothetical protein
MDTVMCEQTHIDRSTSPEPVAAVETARHLVASRIDNAGTINRAITTGLSFAYRYQRNIKQLAATTVALTANRPTLQ